MKYSLFHARIRNRCSNLNGDLFRNHLSTSPKCQCGCVIEDADHFFFICPKYNLQRQQLFAATRRFHPLSANILLFGKESLTTEENGLIFIEVQNYIKATERFLKVVLDLPCLFICIKMRLACSSLCGFSGTLIWSSRAEYHFSFVVFLFFFLLFFNYFVTIHVIHLLFSISKFALANRKNVMWASLRQIQPWRTVVYHRKWNQCKVIFSVYVVESWSGLHSVCGIMFRMCSVVFAGLWLHLRKI